MCITAADIRAEEEASFWEALCEKCQDKVLRKTQGTDKSLFSFSPEEYGFCQECLKAIKEVESCLSKDDI